MGSPWGALIGGGLGLGSFVGNLMGADKQRDLEAAKALYSPWTGMKPDTNNIKEGNLIRDVGGGVVSGVGMDQSNEASERAQDALDKMSGWMLMNASPSKGNTGSIVLPASRRGDYRIG